MLRALVMFAAIIGIRTNAKSGSQPTEAPRPKLRTLRQHRNKASTVDSKLEQGERCWNFLKDTWGEERAEAYRCAVLYQAGIQTDAGPQLGLPANASSGSQQTPLHPKLPYTFWNSYMPTVLALRKKQIEARGMYARPEVFHRAQQHGRAVKGSAAAHTEKGGLSKR